MHTHYRGGHYRRSFLRRNAFYIALIAAALAVWLGSCLQGWGVSVGRGSDSFAGALYLRRSLYGVSPHSNIMALPTCPERLAALSVLPDDSTGLAISANIYIRQRHDVYRHMAQDVEQKGLLLGGVITQGLTQRDLFHITVLSPELRKRRLSLIGRRSSAVTIEPILKPLEVPVRATILPLLDSHAAWQIGRAVQQLLTTVVPEGGIWLQDNALFHATVFHASSHAKPIPASREQVEEEHRLIKTVTSRTCPIKAVLEKVVVTSGGVIVACWQATAQGGEPALLRQSLADALPSAPPKEAQMVKEQTMLHTTLARLLQAPSQEPGAGAESIAPINTQAVISAVQQLNNMLCGLEATFNELWFVEEQDLLALALQGRYLKHRAPLTCPQ